jgi:PTH1 family peptidyl-tRNA hydrolase
MSQHEVLIVGLGNPGPEYDQTRHNIGFDLIDELNRRWNFGSERVKWKSQLLAGDFAGNKIHLLKPQTYMNRSGESVAQYYGFFKLAPHQLLVIHDDLDMDTGRIKLVRGGGHGGHKGIKSIVASLGIEQFYRLKIGIGRPGKDGVHPDFPVEKYVLSRFSDAQRASLKTRLAAVGDGLEVFLREGSQPAMTILNSLR